MYGFSKQNCLTSTHAHARTQHSSSKLAIDQTFSPQHLRPGTIGLVVEFSSITLKAAGSKPGLCQYNFSFSFFFSSLHSAAPQSTHTQAAFPHANPIATAMNRYAFRAAIQRNDCILLRGPIRHRAAYVAYRCS